MSDLSTRSSQMIRTGEPFRLVGTLRSIHFLRGVLSRASMCLPAFYYFLGSASALDAAKVSDDYPFKVAQSYAQFSDLHTLTLACRKIFDHATKPDLTGANFGKTSDYVLSEHATYWASHSGQPEDHCLNALIFLRKFFSEYSKTDSVLLQQEGTLHKRIGLLKQHADRAAAHLSLDNYSIDVIDLAHFTASITMVGEIVRNFDDPLTGEKYFNEVDEAAFAAAKRVFPQITDFQLFGQLRVSKQARFFWMYQHQESVQSCFDKLQFAIG